MALNDSKELEIALKGSNSSKQPLKGPKPL